MKIRNIFGTLFSGALGKDRSRPRGTATTTSARTGSRRTRTAPSKEEERSIYRQAVQAWKALCDRQKEFYKRIAEGMSGYNLFVGRHIRAVRAGKDPEVPIALRHVTDDGTPVPDGCLLVRMRDRPLFTDGLEDGKGEVALTPSDAPYTFLLRRGAQEETVATVHDLLEADIPLALASEALGIGLVLGVAVPPEARPTS